ncbi:GAF domain containing protein [Muriicola marianensis]|uniref:GAF domain containing protein n=2 Tax=Muriicola marianensis TaxID=1324801 RepID=A0ABQ1R2D3_9FLAO|nr:GAF domain containing protein [Muriicola marianensis]
MSSEKAAAKNSGFFFFWSHYQRGVIPIFAKNKHMLEGLKSGVETILKQEGRSVDERLQTLCEYLKAEVSYYDWVGFYFRNGEKEELKLGPYAGAPTDHTIIPFGKGICGQVAVSNANFVVPDVTAQDNYIACSLTVKSEIVIPLFVEGKNIGQIDIDSETPDPFTEEDERFLEFVNTEVAKIL